VSRPLSRNQIITLAIGDTLVLLAVTVIGFATHSQSLGNARWLVTFLPLAAAWFLAAPWFGLFSDGTANRLTELWRPMLTAVFAAPLAVLLRALWLQQTVIPVFGLVMIATTAAGMGIWRAIWTALTARKQLANGRA